MTPVTAQDIADALDISTLAFMAEFGTDAAFLQELLEYPTDAEEGIAPALDADDAAARGGTDA